MIDDEPTDCRATDDDDACGVCDACIDRLERNAALHRPMEYGYGGPAT